VESNDPVNPKATLHVSASIEIEFGFETTNLNFGHIRKGESTIKTAVLILKDQSKKGLLELNSQSPHVAVKTVKSTNNDGGQIGVEVTVKPEAPPGELSETITAKLSDGSHQASALRINGTIVGNVEVTPEFVRFTIDTSQTSTNQATQEVKISSTQSGAALQVLGVEDTSDYLTFEIDTVAAGEQYVVRAKPNAKALRMGRNVSGQVKVLTSDTEQPKVTFRYNIIFLRR